MIAAGVQETAAVARGSVSPVILGVAVAYFTVCGFIAVRAARATRTSDDFFVAGKGIGLWTMTLAAMAATLSGFIFIGGPGLLYASGIGALFISLSATITTPLSAWTLARPMRLLREVRQVVTVPDAVRARYRSPAAQGLCAVALLIATIGYVATNLLALGHVLGAIVPVTVTEGTVIGAAIVLAYSATGGILAGVRTDVFQGAVKAVASVLVFAAVLHQGQGLGGISHTILMHAPELLGPWGTMTPLAALSLFFVFGVGTLGQPHVISKYYMLRDPLKLRWYPLLMTIVLLVTLLLFFSVGLGVKAAVLGGAMPPLKVADDATPAFLLARTSPWLAGVVLSGIVAASMGIVNAFLNVAAAALTHDIPAAWNRRLSSELLYGRIATLVVALVALVVAIQSGAVVALLGIFGWGLFAATLVPSLAIGLNWKGASRAGAIASMATGLAVTILFELFNRFSGYHTPPSVSAAGVELLLATLMFFVVSWCTPHAAARDLDPDIARIISA